MKTVVFQSFRTSDVPQWLSVCMASVKRWADSYGWEYHFKNDEFFAIADAQVRKQCANNIYALTDICRLLWIKEFLQSHYDRAIWIDADVLIFAPENIVVESSATHAFAFELLMESNDGGDLRFSDSVSNAFMIFTKNDLMLDIYIEQSLRTLMSNEKISRTAIGPKLLADIARGRSLTLLQGVGLFTYAMMSSISESDMQMLLGYQRKFPAPLGAANLCHFLRNATPIVQRTRFDQIYNIAVDELLKRGIAA